MKKISSFALKCLIVFFTITLVFLSQGGATTDLSFIPNKIEVPIITKDATVSEERKMYCEKLLERYTEILKKDYSQLTEEEMETLELINYLFLKTGICVAYLWHDYIKEFKGFDKLSKDKVSILLSVPSCDIWSCKEINFVDLTPFLEKITNCQGKSSFEEKARCMAKSNINAWKKAFLGDGGAFIVSFALKQKYKNSVDIFMFKPYFAGLLLITPERFEERYKDFQKRPTMPLCRFSFSHIDCPYFHLEKKFNLPFNINVYRFDIDKQKEENLFAYVLQENKKKQEKITRSEELSKEEARKETQESIERYRKMSEEIKNKNLHKDPILFEKEFKRIYDLSQDVYICPFTGKFVSIENIKPAKLIGFVIPNTSQCKNAFNTELKILFYSTKEVYTWMEKEFGLRGYLK